MNGAREFAIAAHGDQKYGSHPYAVHLDSVANVLMEFGVFEACLLRAAYLHDVLEDTRISRETLRDMYGEDTTSLVELVTDLPGANRSERHASTYPQIALNPKAVTLKLADRIANVRMCDASLLAMYRKEYSEFVAALKGKHHGAMWQELDRLLL